MNRLFKFAAICLCMTQMVFAQFGPKDPVTCTYYNDPHLVPFPSATGTLQGQFLCSPNCTEVLLKNKYVEILVKSDPNLATGYPIVSYTLIFYGIGPGISAFAISDSIANPSAGPFDCPIGSAVISLISPNYHYYDYTSANLQVAITYMGTHFNIQITQPLYLVAQSEGVCVKWDCPEEKPSTRGKRQTSTDAVASDICKSVIEIAQERLRDYMDPQPVPWYQASCTNDLVLTANPTYPKGIVREMVLDSLKGYKDKPDFREYFKNMDDAGDKAISEAEKATEELYQMLERGRK